MEKLDDFIERDEVNEWLDKKAMMGKQQSYRIDDVLKINNDVVLALSQGSGDESRLIRLSSMNKNGCIDKFGNKPSEWIGNFIAFDFQEFIPKEGSKVSAGVKAVIVWEETIKTPTPN